MTEFVVRKGFEILHIMELEPTLQMVHAEGFIDLTLAFNVLSEENS